MCALAGIFFRPLEPTLVMEDEEEEVKKELNDNQLPLMIHYKNGGHHEIKKAASFASIPENNMRYISYFSIFFIETIVYILIN
jgi:hypothetical protein